MTRIADFHRAYKRIEGITVRDKARIEPLLKRIQEVWEANPNLRLGQIIYNISDGDMFYTEDEQLVKAVELGLKGNSPK